MFCEKCGNQLPDDSVFCDKCGARVEDGSPNSGSAGNTTPVMMQAPGQVTPGQAVQYGTPQQVAPPMQTPQQQTPQAPVPQAMPMQTPQQQMPQTVPTQAPPIQTPQNLPKGMTMDENGNYRWTYKLDMIKVPVLRNMIMKIIFFSCLGVGAFIGLINLIQGEDLDVILTGGGILAIVALVILAITFVVYYIVISIHGRYYTVDHLMNEKGVEHIQSPEEDAQSDKMKKLVFVLELLNPDPATVGLAMAGKEHMTSEYKDVKKVVEARRYGLIKVHNTLQQNHIYAYPEQYEFVWNYITHHCQNAKIKG